MYEPTRCTDLSRVSHGKANAFMMYTTSYMGAGEESCAKSFKSGTATRDMVGAFSSGWRCIR